MSLFASSKTNPQTIHLVIDSQGRSDKMSPTTKKVLQATSVILIVLGLSLIIGGSMFFGLGAAAACGVLATGMTAILLAVAPTMVPLGMTSLLSGCHLLYLSEKGSISSSTLNITDLLKIK